MEDTRQLSTESKQDKGWREYATRVTVGFLSLAILMLLITYTVLSIQHTREILEAVEEEFGDVLIISRANGLILTDIFVFFIGFCFVFHWVAYGSICSLILSLGPVVITWSLLMATLLQTYQSNSVGDDFSSKSVQCNDIEMEVLEIPRDALEDYLYSDPGTRRIYLSSIGIDLGKCRTTVILAFVCLTCVKLLIAVSVYSIQANLEKNVKEGSLGCKRVGIKVVFSCEIGRSSQERDVIEAREIVEKETQTENNALELESA